MPRDGYPPPRATRSCRPRQPHTAVRQSCKHPHRCSPFTSGKGRLPAGEQQPNVWDVLVEFGWGAAPRAYRLKAITPLLLIQHQSGQFLATENHDVLIVEIRYMCGGPLLSELL